MLPYYHKINLRLIDPGCAYGWDKYGCRLLQKIIILVSIRYWARVIVALTSSIVFGPSFPSSFFIASKTNCSLFCRNFFSFSHNSMLYCISVGAVLRIRKLFSFDALRCYSVARRVSFFFFLSSSTAWDSIPTA